MNQPRRKIVEMHDKSKIATMAEPTTALAEQCLVMLVWWARELLGDAELERPSSHLRLGTVAEAISYLHTSSMLIENIRVRAPEDLSGPDIGMMLTQAVGAAKSAEAQIALHSAYLAGEDVTLHRADKQRSIARRSCEAAKKEAHRALVELLNIYPDAWEEEA